MININNLVIEEKINNLLKAIEIVGGKRILENELSDKDKAATYVLASAFDKGSSIILNIGEMSYSLVNLLDIKIDYEKYFLKNKKKAIDGIMYKIKKYDTSLDSKIRKYKKTLDLKEYNEIYSEISNRYRRDINIFVLKAIDHDIISNLSMEDNEKFYGEYLNEKRKHLIQGLIRSMGIK